MVNISNHGRKCLSDLLPLEPCNDMFKVISEIMAHRYDMLNSINIAINQCNANNMNVALMFIINNTMEKNVLLIYYHYNHVMTCMK